MFVSLGSFGALGAWRTIKGIWDKLKKGELLANEL
jgi:hypothetical protein